MSEKENIDENVEAQQPLVEHLVELRNRLLYSVLTVLIVFLCLFYFANDLYAFVSEPLRLLLPEGQTMIATGVASPFLTPFKLTLVASLFISMPMILFQIWLFIAPALYKNEKRLAVPLLISSIILFYAGMAFAYYVVFPLVFEFFANVAPEGVSVTPDISFYLDFVLKLFFAFGMAFEVPIATVILVAAGVTTTASLAEKRPYIFVGCFIFGMLLTPPDVISQILLAVPMWLLFELGIVFARLIEKKEDGDEKANSAT